MHIVPVISEALIDAVSFPSFSSATEQSSSAFGSCGKTALRSNYRPMRLTFAWGGDATLQSFLPF